MSGRHQGWRSPAYPVLLGIGWVTVGLAVLLLVGGLLIGGAGPLPPSKDAAHAAGFLARIAPWPILLPLGVVLLVVARAATAGRGWPRGLAIAISLVFIGFSLLGVRWAAASGGLVLLGKVVWIAANGYVVAALASGSSANDR